MILPDLQASLENIVYNHTKESQFYNISNDCEQSELRRLFSNRISRRPKNLVSAVLARKFKFVKMHYKYFYFGVKIQIFYLEEPKTYLVTM